MEWIAILTLECLARHTAEAKANMEDGDTWHERKPVSVPCLAYLDTWYNGGVNGWGWLFVEMDVAVRLCGFAPVCGHCMFGRLVTNVETGAMACTACGRAI